jgi:uncharacterized membrane protein
VQHTRKRILVQATHNTTPQDDDNDDDSVESGGVCVVGRVRVVVGNDEQQLFAHKCFLNLIIIITVNKFHDSTPTATVAALFLGFVIFIIVSQ